METTLPVLQGAPRIRRASRTDCWQEASADPSEDNPASKAFTGSTTTTRFRCLICTKQHTWHEFTRRRIGVNTLFQQPSLGMYHNRTKTVDPSTSNFFWRKTGNPCGKTNVSFVKRFSQAKQRGNLKQRQIRKNRKSLKLGTECGSNSRGETWETVVFSRKRAGNNTETVTHWDWLILTTTSDAVLHGKNTFLVQQTVIAERGSQLRKNFEFLSIRTRRRRCKSSCSSRSSPGNFCTEESRNTSTRKLHKFYRKTSKNEVAIPSSTEQGFLVDALIGGWPARDRPKQRWNKGMQSRAAPPKQSPMSAENDKKTSAVEVLGRSASQPHTRSGRCTFSRFPVRV